MKLAVSLSHAILTSGQAVLAMILQHQTPVRVVIRVLLQESLVRKPRRGKASTGRPGRKWQDDIAKKEGITCS